MLVELAVSAARDRLWSVGREHPGVDSTLIEEMLRLSPEERLRQNDLAVANVEELRRAFAAAQPDVACDKPRR